MKFKKLFNLFSATVVTLSALMSVGIPMAHAATYSCKWTGLGGDNKFSTAANWSTCNGANVPVSADHDNLIFDKSTATPGTLINDLSGGFNFSSITFQGSGVGGFNITGNAITLMDGTGGINQLSTGSGSVDTLDVAILLTSNYNINVSNQSASLKIGGTTSDISGSNNLTKSGAGTLVLAGDNSSWTGSLTASGGTVSVSTGNAFGAGATGGVFNNGADFKLGSCSDFTFNGKITLNNGSSVIVGDFPYPKLNSAVGCAGGGGGGADENYGTADQASSHLTLAGAITLGSDVTFGATTGTTTITGALIGAHVFSVLPGYPGKLVVSSSSNGSSTPNGTYTSALFTKTISDSSASSVNIFGNNQISIDGGRGNTTVFSGGVLKGTGSVGTLDVKNGGTVAPGHSPGCLTTGSLSLSGTYQVQIGGTTACSGYDQLKVSGSVTLSGSTLSPIIYNGFVPSAGQSFVIISNDGTDAVSGTFSGLAEGSKVTVGGVTYTLSYKGGDGNDVTLTFDSIKAPGAPNTGTRKLVTNPILSLVGSTLAAVTLLVLSRRIRADR